ncbi:DMT family transporter [Kiloniella sp. EL199]|uniref:DMT family transporter n=1 Tax=Kiloniella sp. EL199 TaxID=2107581 RepID=UPI0013C44384|nr:DMT family transporter [Kiloniella sp. EL199]
MSLTLGLLAALAWGIHDVCVRYVSQKTNIFPAFLTVLIIGTIFTLPIALIMGNWKGMTNLGYYFSIVSGIFYAIGGISLYMAFSIGPVRIAAPIIGAYPIISVGWASLTGESVSLHEWAAVFIIVTGVSLVTKLSDKADKEKTQKQQIFWAFLSCFFFGATFAAGQLATRHGGEFPVILIARITSVTVILLIALSMQKSLKLHFRQMPILASMGFLDALALGLVTAAGTLPYPEYAAITSSLFGMLTVILAWAFLKETMTLAQWCSVILVFTGVGILGY